MTFLAPCGHPGVPIIGTYVSCLSCDGKARVTPPSSELTVTHCNKVWNASLVRKGNKIPKEATHGWCLTSGDSGIPGYNQDMPLVEALAFLEKYEVWKTAKNPGWSLIQQFWRFENEEPTNEAHYVVFWEKT